MIPCRVKLSGFLSYKDEQEVRFDDSQMWMLAGMNGSGKSSVFDAMTYALFGVHRGGSQLASELINKDSKGLSVEFEFRIDGRLYLARRTLRRNTRGTATGTQQLSEWQPSAGDGPGKWDPIADTSRKAEFDNWIHENIGLNFETFTSSVLLLQGKAEKLLDSKPSGRAEVLAGIVDLERYQRLHERADGRRREAKACFEAIQSQYDAVEEVTDEEYADALAAIERAADECREAEQRYEHARTWELQARQWSELNARIAQLKRKLVEGDALLGEAVKIEKDYETFCELRAVLPHVETVLTVGSRLAESERATAQWKATLGEEQLLQEKADRELIQCRARRTKLQACLAEDEQNQRTVEAQLRELSGILGQVKVYENQQEELERYRRALAELPEDPESGVKRLRAELARLEDLGRLLPTLRRFDRERAGLREATGRAEKSGRESGRLRQEGIECKQQADALAGRLKAATEERGRADEEATTARTLARQAELAEEQFRDLKGEPTCRSCGQALSEEHFADEMARRAADRERATDGRAKAEARQAECRRREAELTEESGRFAKRLEELRDGWRVANAEQQKAEEAVTRHGGECRQLYLELPREFAERVAPRPPEDWTATAYPDDTELRSLAAEVASVEVVRAERDRAEDLFQRWKELNAKLRTTEQNLAALFSSLRGNDPVTARERDSALRVRAAALQDSLEGIRKNLRDNEREADRLAKQLDRYRASVAEWRTKIEVEETTQTHCRETIRRATASLPDRWRDRAAGAGLTAQHEWKVKFDELIASDIEGRHDRLREARLGSEPLRFEIAERQREAEAFPEEARREPAEAGLAVAEAKAQRDRRDEESRAAKHRHDRLDERRKRRAELHQQLLKAGREHNLYALLAKLLGRDRLQRHLVRQAERQIIDRANSVLDRLSAGELRLRLSGQDSEDPGKALELEAINRVTGDSPINVAFLSGSQRFRVAVSLAVGIGQYASRRHRPIESVIIDEGFGCLDRQGRQGMIQELQNLKGQLHCILLVSHQEEFADAFPDGYRFELEDGSTRVTRFRR